MIDDGELGEGELVVDENYEPDSADAVAQIEGEAGTYLRNHLQLSNRVVKRAVILSIIN